MGTKNDNLFLTDFCRGQRWAPKLPVSTTISFFLAFGEGQRWAQKMAILFLAVLREVRGSHQKWKFFVWLALERSEVGTKKGKLCSGWILERSVMGTKNGNSFLSGFWISQRWASKIEIYSCLAIGQVIGGHQQ